MSRPLEQAYPVLRMQERPVGSFQLPKDLDFADIVRSLMELEKGHPDPGSDNALIPVKHFYTLYALLGELSREAEIVNPVLSAEEEDTLGIRWPSRGLFCYISRDSITVNIRHEDTVVTALGYHHNGDGIRQTVALLKDLIRL